MTKFMSFEVQRCVNTTENNGQCRPDSEIDEYLNKASIEIWTIESKVDMNKYKEVPLYRIMEFQGRKLLNVGYL